MKTVFHITILLFSSFICVVNTHGQGVSSNSIISLGVPFTEGGGFFQKVKYEIDSSVKLNVNVQCFQLRQLDSVELYHLTFNKKSFKEGVNSITLRFEKNDSAKYKNKDFFDVVKKTSEVPPGNYRSYLTMSNVDGALVFKKDFSWYVDSTLPYNSDMRNQINGLFAPSSKKVRIKINNRNRVKGKPSNAELTRMNTRINRRFKNGVTANPETIEGKSYSALYYKQWFLGRYEVVSRLAMRDKVENERKALKNKSISLVDNDISDFSTVSSQTKRLHKKDKCDQETRGNIGFTTGFGNGQEPNSQQKNYYQEVNGVIHTSIKNIPVVIEGFYTTQDIGRQAKASYLRIHYDVEESKNQVKKKISTFKSKYNETKNMRMDGSYTHLLSSLNSENSNIKSLFLKKYGLDIDTIDEQTFLSHVEVDTTGLGGDGKAKKSAADAKEMYAKYEKNKDRINKYSKVLEQYGDKMYLDSALTYARLEKLNEGNASYKELANAAADLLPEDNTSKFIRGITNFDLGILNQYESDYTMSGQVLKGGGFGYDFGFFKARAAMGKTEYISRDGNVEAYNTYMVRADSRVSDGQDVGLIYYTYSPTKNALESENFKKDVISKSFMSPTHVLSFVYSGKFGKKLIIQSEGATSYDQVSKLSKVSKDNTAAKIGAEYLLTSINTSITGEWEHMGKEFENSAMPIKRNGTERYTLGSNATIVKSLITLGVQYNFIKQLSFASTGYNRRWGFDVKTNFRRYPNLYVSYKPFTTFRAYNDTFSIAQRPILGEVTTSRLTYQFRKNKSSHRFMVMYNNNKNTADTITYESRFTQVGYIYSSGINMLCVNAGWMSVPFTDSALSGDLYFINSSLSKSINEQITLSGGPDIALSKNKLEKISATAGVTYLFQKKPIGLRLQVRYTHFTDSLYLDKNNLWAGLVGVDWRFKMKKNCQKIK